jgi:hypothetical protein
MKPRWIGLIAPFVFFHGLSPCGTFETRDTSGMRWYKGNTHSHARRGESDTTAAGVAAWYQGRGYRFLVITDHSVVTLPMKDSDPTDGAFLLIPGAELICESDSGNAEISALNVRRDIPPVKDGLVGKALQKGIDKVRSEGGVPVINHPNFQWRLDAATMLGVRDCALFELYNGFPGVNNDGEGGHPGLESVWDFLLTSGKRIYGVAADDGHAYTRFAGDEPNPGRGWVTVRSGSLDAGEIVQNLESGLFYSSTGVELDDIRVTPDRIEIVIRNAGYGACTTLFIGESGRILLSTRNNPAVYGLNAVTAYVRAKVIGPDGRCAWIQPQFIRP